jgi:hypothetical protein
MLTPEGSGKWKVSRDGAFTFTMKGKDDMSVTENFESLTFTGEYDEALAAFSMLDGKAGKATFEESMKDEKGQTIKVSGGFDSFTFKGTGTANAAGGVDLKINETIGAGQLTEDIASGEDGAEPFHLNVKFGGGTLDGTFTGTKTAAGLELLKFISAHPDPKVSVSDRDELKGLLRGILPGFATMDISGSINSVSAETSLGAFKLGKLGFGLNGNGLVKDGKFEEKLSVEGVELPAGLVPSWATALVTKNAGFGVQVSGYDLETFIKAEIDSADFTKDTAISKEDEDKNAALLLPKGAVDVTLTQYNMSNDTYSVSATGKMQAGPAAQPTGQAHISIKGIDEVMKVAQAAPPEAGLQQVSAVIVVAKGLAKPDADGALGWDISATPDGKITINGMDINSLK